MAVNMFNHYKKQEMHNKYINTIKDLSFLDVDDIFIVSNGRWQGKIESRNEDGITISMYNNDNIYFMNPIRSNVFYKNDYKVNWYIDTVYRKIPIDILIKQSYNSLCSEFGENNVNRVLSNMYKELQMKKTVN